MDGSVAFQFGDDAVVSSCDSRKMSACALQDSFRCSVQNVEDQQRSFDNVEAQHQIMPSP